MSFNSSLPDVEPSIGLFNVTGADVVALANSACPELAPKLLQFGLDALAHSKRCANLYSAAVRSSNSSGSRGSQRSQVALRLKGTRLDFIDKVDSWRNVKDKPNSSHKFPDGLCYLKVLKETCADSVHSSLGEWPTLGKLARLSAKKFKTLDELERFRLIPNSDGSYHLAAGGVRGYSFLDAMHVCAVSKPLRDGMLGAKVLETARVVESGISTSAKVGGAKTFLCPECLFLVDPVDHQSRCRVPQVKDVELDKTKRLAAWTGDAVHCLDVRMMLVDRCVSLDRLESESQKYLTNASQKAYLGKVGVDVGTMSDHKAGTLFEALYHGGFRKNYLISEFSSAGERVFNKWTPPVSESGCYYDCVRKVVVTRPLTPRSTVCVPFSDHVTAGTFMSLNGSRKLFLDSLFIRRSDGGYDVSVSGDCDIDTLNDEIGCRFQCMGLYGRDHNRL